MSKSYVRKDRYYKLAKTQGFRSRAAYKLKELNDKYKFIKSSSKVLDLGAWPGGWMQVAGGTIGKDGLIVGIDLVEIEQFQEDTVRIIRGDVCDEAVILEAKSYCPNLYDVVLSDMSPKLSGIKEADRARAVGCAELALWASNQLLKNDGTLVIKVFKSNETDEFVRGEMRKSFVKVTRIELDSTRTTSNEFYVIGFGFKKPVSSLDSMDEHQ